MSALKRILKKPRLLNFLFGVIYVQMFREIYTGYLVPIWGYLGYELNNTTSQDIILCDILCLVPLLFYDVDKKLSNFISIMIYIFMYVPALIAMQYFWGCMFHIDYMMAFFAGMTLFFLASRSRVSKSKYKTNIGKLNLSVFVVLGFFCALVLLYIFRNNLHMVSFADVYDLREENSNLGKDVPLSGYFQMWCQNLFSPLLMSVGLYNKNKSYIIMGFMMSLLMYTATGLKSTIINPFVIIGFYYFMKRYMSRTLALFLPFFTILIGVLYLSSQFFKDPAVRMAYSVIFMRSIGIAAQLAPCYITVFDSHSFTYYSHVNIVNKITGIYPFSNPSLGNAVWEEYTGGDENNANANFWLTDGTAAMGVLGVVVISVFFYYILIYLNKLSNEHDQTTIFSMLIPIIVSLTNASVFTTLLSSGLIMAMIIMRYCKLTLSQNCHFENKINYKIE